MTYKKKVLLLSAVLLFSSCKNKKEDVNNSSKSDSVSQLSSTLAKKFSDILFEDQTYDYDGKEHILKEAEGYPDGTNVSYEGRNPYKDCGSYSAKVHLKKEGYESFTKEAILTILPIEYSGIEYKSVTLTYDGSNHIDAVKLTGFLPEGTTASQTIKDENGNEVNEAVQVGTYRYHIRLTNKNYKDLELDASLTIQSETKDIPILIHDEDIYFMNTLDHNYLYRIDKEGNAKQVDYSVPKKLNESQSNMVLSLSDSLLGSTVKEYGEETKEVLYTDSNITDFVKYDSNTYYYSKNTLLKESCGIYKVKNSSTREPEVEKIFEGRSDKISLSGNYLYFQNKEQDSHLYRINLTNNSISLVLDQEIKEYMISDHSLYGIFHSTLNDYIGMIDLNSSERKIEKLTDASGKNLIMKDGFLYYTYNDLYGKIDESRKGIWKIDVTSKTNTQILSGKNLTSFDVKDSNTLVYIDNDNLHPYEYRIQEKTSKDLIPGFVPPETTPTNIGGKSISYNGSIYYLDMYRGKTLNRYDEKTKVLTQLSSNKVDDFSIIGDILYFNQVTTLTNNDLYCVDLKNGGIAKKLTSNDCRKIVSDGTYLYGTHYNFLGTSGGIFRMKPDGTQYVKFSNINGAKNFRIKNNKLYFINCASGQDNGKIEFIDLSQIHDDSTNLKSNVLSKNIKNVKQFEFDGDNIYYIYNGITDNSIKKTDLSTLKEGIPIASSKTNPSEFILDNNDIYYYSYAATSTSNAGFYKVSKNADKDGTQTLLCSYEETYYATSLAISNENLYFLNYIPKLLLGDAHYYQLNLKTRNITKIN